MLHREIRTDSHEDPALEPRQVLAVVYADGCASFEQRARAEELMRTDAEFRRDVEAQQRAAAASVSAWFLNSQRDEFENVFRRVLKRPRPFRSPNPGAGVFLLAIGLAVCGR